MTINREQFLELYEIIAEAMNENDPVLVLKAVLRYLKIKTPSKEEKPFNHPICDVFFSLHTPLERIYGFIEFLRKKGFQSFLLPDGKIVRTEAPVEVVKKIDTTFGIQSIAKLRRCKND